MLTRTTLRRARPRAGGFTLIELLVVIAIIAILTAIIFPVFATMRENARQQTAIANLHEIQSGLAQFKLDNGHYPEVLFGYVVPGASMDKALTVAEQYNAASQYFPGLYPEYVKDPLTFTDPNNIVKDLSKTTVNSANGGPVTVNSLVGTNSTTYTLTPVKNGLSSATTGTATNFYLADAFDISPEIDTSGNKTNTLLGSNGDYTKMTYVPRYQTSWTDIGTTAANNYDSAANASPSYVNYNRQMRWTNPPADTYVTCTTHHVPNSNRVIVLWESGAAKAMDASQFLAGAAGKNAKTDTTTAPVGANPADTAKFWQVSPTNTANPGY